MLSCRLSSPIAVRAFGFKTPAKTKFSGYELLVGMNPPGTSLLVPSASGIAAFFNAPDISQQFVIILLAVEAYLKIQLHLLT